MPKDTGKKLADMLYGQPFDVPTPENLRLGQQLIERDLQEKAARDAKLTSLDKLKAAYEAAKMMGSGAIATVGSIPTRVAYGPEAAEKYVAERISIPTTEKGMDYVQNVGDFLEQLETKYKLPPIMPEAMAMQYLTGPATKQATRIAGQKAMQAGKAGERFAEQAVPQVMERGGVGADVLSGLTQGSRANIVPPELARKLSTTRSLPQSEIFQQAVVNTPGASISDEGLRMALQRGQKAEQKMAPSVRGGVFYLPKGAAQAKHYSKSSGAYGGAEKITGETTIANPLFVKGSTGGKAPEQAYIQLMGKDAFKAMQDDLMGVMSYGAKGDKRANVSNFLSKYAPELEDYAGYIVDSSKQGNQLRYALQEAAIGSAARKAGHDAIVGYSKKKTGQPFISEVFDVREVNYPSQYIEPEIWEDFTQAPLKAHGGRVHISDNPDVMQLELAGGKKKGGAISYAEGGDITADDLILEERKL